MDSSTPVVVENVTSIEYTDSFFFVTVTKISGYTGLVAVLLNGFILICIARLLYKKTSSFLVQCVFVSSIDAGAGLSLFVISHITVSNGQMVEICAVMAKCIVAFQVMAKGNILCICLQRLIFAVNLRRAVTQWKTRHTLSLVLVNVALGTIVALMHETAPSFINSDIKSRLCSPLVLNLNRYVSSVSFFLAGFLLVLASDVFCLLTILKLIKSTNVIHVSHSGSSQINSNLSGDIVTNSARQRYRHAVVTILIMSVTFTLFSLPVLGMIIATNVMELSPAVQRLSVLVGYLPVLVNPVLIISRTRDLRKFIKDDLVLVYHHILNLLDVLRNSIR